MRQIYYIVASMRPWQWSKNLVVFAGLVFSRNVGDRALSLLALEAFAVFCLLSGVIYIVNDIADLEKDRRHESKRNRPLPSGRLGVRTAAVAAAVLSVVGIGAAQRLGPGFLVTTCIFLALNVIYSFALKRVALLDVVSIAVSFILRAIGGVEALRSADMSIEISPWLLICTLFLAHFLGFCKRRHELVTLADAANHRESLSEYSPALLDQLVGMTAAGSVLAYAIYAIWPDTVEKFGTTDLVYTVPLVLLGVMRYLYLVYNKQKGGNPSRLLLEKFLLIDVLAWMVLVVAIVGGF